MLLNNRRSLIRGRLKKLTGGAQEDIDTVKKDDYKYNVEDWAWRLKKLRPDTDVDVEETKFFYDNIPAKAVSGTSNNYGTFEHQGDNGNINIWYDMVPDSQYDGLHSKYSRLSRILSHETNHNYHHNLLNDANTKEEEKLLMEAYPDEIFNAPVKEGRRATNMELRKQVSQWADDVTMEDLDKAIDKINPTQLMDMYFRANGYTQDPTKQNRKYMQLPNGNWDRKKIDLIKKALKNVASTNKSSNSFSTSKINPSLSFGIRRRLENRGSQSV